SGLPSPDAAVRLPALGGHSHGAGRPTAQLGASQQAPRVRDAAGRRAAGRPPNDAADALKLQSPAFSPVEISVVRNASASRVFAEPGCSGFCWLSCGAQPDSQTISKV